MMKQKTSWFLLLICLSLFFAGCSNKLSKEAQTFSEKGSTFSINLPKNWEEDKNFKAHFGLQAVLGAEDKKSNSYMFILTTPVEEVTEKNFGEETRKKLAERYNYKKADDIYMSELKIDDKPAYKYTLNTYYKEKSVWAHLYYIWTEHNFVQMIFYSADDGSYQKRAEIIDESALTFKETKFDQKKQDQISKEEEQDEGDIVTVENADMKISISASRYMTGKDEEELLAIRYTFTNLKQEPVAPNMWQEVISATQDGKELTIGTLPEDTPFLDVKSLVEKQAEPVSTGESSDSVVVYKINNSDEVTLSFSQEAFPEQESYQVVVPK